MKPCTLFVLFAAFAALLVSASGRVKELATAVVAVFDSVQGDYDEQNKAVRAFLGKQKDTSLVRDTANFIAFWDEPRIALKAQMLSYTDEATGAKLIYEYAVQNKSGHIMHLAKYCTLVQLDRAIQMLTKTAEDDEKAAIAKKGGLPLVPGDTPPSVLGLKDLVWYRPRVLARSTAPTVSASSKTMSSEERAKTRGKIAQAYKDEGGSKGTGVAAAQKMIADLPRQTDLNRLLRPIAICDQLDRELRSLVVAFMDVENGGDVIVHYGVANTVDMYQPLTQHCTSKQLSYALEKLESMLKETKDLGEKENLRSALSLLGGSTRAVSERMEKQRSGYVEPPKPVPAPPPPKEQLALVEALALGEEAVHKVLASMPEDVRKSVLPRVFGDTKIPAIQRALIIGEPEISDDDGGSLIIDAAIEPDKKAIGALLDHCTRAQLENAIQRADQMPLVLTPGHPGLKLYAKAFNYLRLQLGLIDFDSRQKHVPSAAKPKKAAKKPLSEEEEARSRIIDAYKQGSGGTEKCAEAAFFEIQEIDSEVLKTILPDMLADPKLPINLRSVIQRFIDDEVAGSQALRDVALKGDEDALRVLFPHCSTRQLLYAKEAIEAAKFMDPKTKAEKETNALLEKSIHLMDENYRSVYLTECRRSITDGIGAENTESIDLGLKSLGLIDVDADTVRIYENAKKLALETSEDLYNIFVEFEKDPAFEAIATHAKENGIELATT